MNALEMASRLRSLTGFEEDWLGRQAEQTAPARLCHRLLARCLEPAGGDGESRLHEVRALRLDERDRLLMELRRRSFGEHLRAEARCPGCGETNEVDAPARSVAPKQVPDLPPAVVLSGGRRAVLRPLTAADHECFQSAAITDASTRNSTALSRAVLEGPEQPWSPADQALVMEALAAATPEPVLLHLECCNCGRAVAARFDPSAFFVAEARQHARTLLDDVHTLASVYHWSEREIFGLPLHRRLAYLMKIEAANDRALWRGKAM